MHDGTTLVIRPAVPGDAGPLIEYLRAVAGESTFLTFDPDEFLVTEEQEEAILRGYQESDNQLYLIGLVDGAIVAALTFSAGSRRRVRHRGELGMSVREAYWGRGIGALMLDTLIGWARGTGIIGKINLHVRADNARAVALYLRKGFAIEGTMSRGMLIDGIWHDHHAMGLEID